ncbi:BgTH12-04597 [Blumeria graminis f. sp. triticale]|uniref:BgTH12-04597 n=1 Tax=Blumeria graminis f. sp. triticale TaxID=1689686 RepID=A0A9W4DG99_BLUGR|nr:BgTH12-04597 [Blumeria graminis f. sp. triticale]
MCGNVQVHLFHIPRIGDLLLFRYIPQNQQKEFGYSFTPKTIFILSNGSATCRIGCSTNQVRGNIKI